MTSQKSRSRKRSDTNYQSPPDHVFFIDRNLGRLAFPGQLREAGLRIEIHDDHFRKDESDEAWLTVVGRKGWVVLTQDKMIRYRKRQSQALLSTDVRMFVLMGKNLTGPQLANLFLDTLPKVRRFLTKHKGPFIAKVYRNGLVAPWLEAS